ncbi:MAG: hypothetical protein A3K77_00600 [Euryarchaeota archaeon RBG_13_31_8]|nr:MAG: hypothetical protein A3K77_00600 [Euryarchaeota archaeon RBG_13_31_8]
MNIGFVGLGKLGLPIALAIEAKGHKVIGFDIDPKVQNILITKKIPYREEGAQELLTNSKIKVARLYDLVVESDIIFVAIQTPNKEGYEGINRTPDVMDDFDYIYLINGMKSLSYIISSLDKPKIVVIISTVLPGTFRENIKPILGDNILFCYNPFFIAMGTAIHDFLYPEFILFGVESEYAANKVESFYRTINNSRFVRMSIESAELTKMSYNTFITNKITIANTIMELSHKIPNCNCTDVIDALKMATDRIVSTKYLNGGMGDSGGCHPKDLLSLAFLSDKLGLKYNLYKTLAKIRDSQTEWLADLIIQQHQETELPIIILGYTYKKKTNLTCGSCGILLKNILLEKGIDQITMYDPYVDSFELRCVNPAIFFIGMNHDCFNPFPYKYLKDSVIIDPWRYIEDIEGINIIRVGVGGIGK